MVLHQIAPFLRGLVSTQGCQQPEIQDCSKCLSIPNYYELRYITQRLKERGLTILMDYQKLEFDTDKVRYAKLFNRDMLLLKDAIDKYGENSVLWLLLIASTINYKPRFPS